MLTKMVFENGHFLGRGGPLSTECTSYAKVKNVCFSCNIFGNNDLP